MCRLPSCGWAVAGTDTGAATAAPALPPLSGDEDVSLPSADNTKTDSRWVGTDGRGEREWPSEIIQRPFRCETYLRRVVPTCSSVGRLEEELLTSTESAD